MQNNPQMPNNNGSMIDPATQQPFMPSAPGTAPLNPGVSLTSGYGGSEAISPAPAKKSNSTLIETALLVVMCIVAVVFVWLYIQKYIEWDIISKDLDGQVEKAVAIAVSENTEKLSESFEEQIKSPYRTFTGPEDYGRLSFEYPQTWSVYIAKDASNGGDFEAYLNPGEVNPVGTNTINALRVQIRDVSFDSVVRSYESSISNGKLEMQNDTVGGVLANIYKGEVSQRFRGAVMILKIRDKTVIMQTDAEVFLDDFYRILDSVTLNV